MKHILIFIVFLVSTLTINAERWERVCSNGNYTYYVCRTLTPSQYERRDGVTQPTFLCKYKQVYTGRKPSESKRIYTTEYVFETFIVNDIFWYRQRKEINYDINGRIYNQLDKEYNGKVNNLGEIDGWSCISGSSLYKDDVLRKMKNMVLMEMSRNTYNQ